MRRLFLMVFVFILLMYGCASSKKQQKESGMDSTQGIEKIPKGGTKKRLLGKLDPAVERVFTQAEEQADAGNFDGSLGELEKLEEQGEYKFLAKYNAGVIYERQGEYAKAREMYEGSLASKPEFTEALINLVRLELRDGGDGLSIADSYIRKCGDCFEHQYAKLEALLAKGRDVEVVDLSRQLLKKDEANTRLRYYMALAEYQRGRYLLAQFIVEQALSISDKDAELYFLKALIEMKLGIILEAQQSVEKALRLNPNYIGALWVKGVMQYQSSNIENAEQLFKRLIFENPKLAAGYLNLGNVYKTQGKGKEAEEMLKKAESLDSESGEIAFSLGGLYLSLDALRLESIQGMDRLKLAKEYFKKSKQLWKSDEGQELSSEFLQKTDKAMVILQSELDAASMGADPFGDDPFGDSKKEQGNPSKGEEGK